MNLDCANLGAITGGKSFTQQRTYHFEVCGTENRVYLAQVDTVKRVVQWTRPDCHLWSCEDCAEINKRRWTAIVAHGIETYQEQGINDWRFVTITSHEMLKTFNQTLWVWRKAWPKLSQRMRREFTTMKYVYLPERHKDGRMHMHGLMSGGMSTRWLKDNARSCGFGYKVESEQPLSVELACYYCLKYISKTLTDRAYWPKSLHRVRTSQHWPKTPKTALFEGFEGNFTTILSSEWPATSAKWMRDGYQFLNLLTGEVEGITF